MLPYYVTTVLGVWFAALAGSRALAGPEGQVGPPRRGAAALMAGAVACLFIGVAGFRYRVGADYRQYAESFDRGNNEFSWSGSSFNSEPAFNALATVGSHFYRDSASMFFLASLVTVGLMVRTYAKYSPMFALSILMMVLVCAWHDSFNGVRQFLAAAIVLAAHGFILERRFKAFFMAVLLASLFHFSAWICLLLYFIPRRRMGFRGQLVLVVVAIIAIGSYDVLGSVVDTVRGKDVSSLSYFAEQVNPLRVMLAFVPYAIALLFVDAKRLSDRGNFFTNVTLLHGVIFLISISSAYLARFTIYTQVFLPIALASVVAACSERNRRWLVPLIVVVYAAFWYLQVSRVPSLNNFRWIWNAEFP